MQNFDSTATEHRANTAFYKVMQSAPMGLLVCAALGLAIVGVFQFIFYFNVFPEAWSALLTTGISASLAIFFECLGFYFLVTTVRDFSTGARREGWLGLLATFLLWAYSIWEATHISATFDRDTPESYAAVFGIIGTIVCIVRIVEIRITLTVTSSMKRIQEETSLLQQLEQERLLHADTTGKLQVYEAEKNSIREAEKQRLQQENEYRAQEEQKRIEDMERENQRLRRQLESSGKTSGQKLSKTDRAAMERKAREFFQKNNMIPTQDQVAHMCGLKDGKSVRIQFPNGSWEAFIGSITVPETTELVNS